MELHDLVPLVLWLGALTLLGWRWPNGDRFHRPACVISLIIWCALPMWEPTMRTVWYFGMTTVAFSCGFFRRPLVATDH